MRGPPCRERERDREAIGRDRIESVFGCTVGRAHLRGQAALRRAGEGTAGRDAIEGSRGSCRGAFIIKGLATGRKDLEGHRGVGGPEGRPVLVSLI